MPSNGWVVAIVVPILVALIGLVGTMRMADIQRKARENEDRLKGFEAYDLTYRNLRADYDRVTTENAALRTENRDLRSTLSTRDRQLSHRLEAMEAPDEEEV